MMLAHPLHDAKAALQPMGLESGLCEVVAQDARELWFVLDDQVRPPISFPPQQEG